MGTTGLATKVDHGYLMAFGAAAAIGGLGGLTQIGTRQKTFPLLHFPLRSTVQATEHHLSRPIR